MRLTTGYGPGKREIWHATDLSLEQRTEKHGQVLCEMEPQLVAGEWTTVNFEFQVGQDGLSAGGHLAVAWRWPYDWSNLQTTDPAEPGFCTVEVFSANEVQLQFDYHPYDGIEPFHHYVDLSLTSGALAAGDCVRLTCGDTSQGSPGWRVPTCCVRALDFLHLIDYEGRGRWTQLCGTANCRVVAGPPVRMVAVTPTDAVVGQKHPVLVRREDAWGNPARSDLPPRWRDMGARMTPSDFRESDSGIWQAYVQVSQPGEYRLHVEAGELAAESNPFRVHVEPPIQQIVWGDLHSGQTSIGCGLGTLQEHFAYGRDVAGLQFITHQANDHYVTKSDWDETRRVTEAFHEPGRYVTILGCEWSPPTADGGDRNVFYHFDEPTLRRSGRFFTESVPDSEPDLPTAPQFHSAFGSLDVLVNMHVGGRKTNLDWHEPRIEQLAEVHSTHGTNEWFFRDCLARGYQVGVTAGTDGVMGRPGACQPGWRLIRNVPNGLTAVYVEELNRDALWEALQARRTYATTGQRIILNVDVDGHPMGSACTCSGEPLIRVQATGTAAIECVDLFRGGDLLCHWDIAPLETEWLRVLWSGTTECGNARAQRAVWDGHLQVFDGEILEAAPLAFSSADHFDLRSTHRLYWNSATAGNDAGVLLKLQADLETVIQFASEPCSFTFMLPQVRRTPMTVEAGGFDRRVMVGAAPRADGPRRVELSFRDTQPQDGIQPYWVRVTQVDRGKAWSSPVYVEREE